MKKGVKVLIGIVLLILVLAVVLVELSMGEPEITLIPKNFEGEVVIFFNIPNGAPKKYEGNSRLYEIPKNGILKTQFSPDDKYISLSDIKYYYYDSITKERILIPYYYDISHIPDSMLRKSDRIIVFSKRLEKGTTNNTHINTTEESILIGKEKNADTLFFKRESGFTPDLIEK